MRGAAATVLLVLVLGGCGGSGAPHARASGAELFSSQCGVCHSLDGNESAHKQGGDLLGYRFDRATLTSFTRQMPTKRRLVSAELRAVVDYVLNAERAAARR